MLGILGGMGPLATADFLRKLVEVTPAERDQDHIETMTLCAAAIPCRIAALEGRGPDPLPAMVVGLRRLEAAGATRLVIPCNTAHHWHASLQAATPLPILHIVDTVVAAMARRGVNEGRIGLLATTGAIRAGVYQTRLAACGFACQLPEDIDETMRAIALVKAHRLAEAGAIFRRQADALLAAGCRQVVLGCTEIPVALAQVGARDARYVDCNEALARACVAACLDHQRGGGASRDPSAARA